MPKAVTTLARSGDTLSRNPARALASSQILEGTPEEKDVTLLENAGRGLRFALWECSPYTERYHDYPVDELMVILSGRVEIEDDTGATIAFGPGDAFILHRGFRGIWRQTERMVKYYMILDSVPHDAITEPSPDERA